MASVPDALATEIEPGIDPVPDALVIGIELVPDSVVTKPF
jgi:hypothetical protein